MLDLTWKIPSSFNLEALLEKDPPDFMGKKKSNLDNFYYIIDLFVEKSLTDDLDKSQGYIKLYSNLLQERMTKEYKKYLNYLKKHQIIQQAQKKYQVSDPKKGISGTSFSYRLKVKYENLQDIKQIPIIGETHKKKRKALWRKFREDQMSLQQKFPSLTKWFDGLEIDIDKCKKWIDSHPDYNLKMEGIKGNIKGKPQKILKRLKALHSIEKIHKKEFHFNVDEKGGRFHSNLTNLKRELRDFLSWEGKKLVNVDIKNSQPFFSQLLLSKNWYVNSQNQISIFQFPTIHNPIIINSKSPSSYLNIFNNIISGEFLHNIDYQDIKIYFEFVNSGSFYERLHQEIFGSETAFDKDEMKKLTFQVLYSSNKFLHQKGDWHDKKTDSYPNADHKRRFKESFPNVYEVFNAYKKKEKNNLAILLQRVESTIILKHIVPRIARERPELPILTIHDSIATTVGNEEYVQRVMKEEILNLTGLHAKLSLEYWSEKPTEGVPTASEFS